MSRQRLIELRETAANLPSGTSEEISSAISRFLIIRSAGHIEYTFDECLNCYATSKAHPNVANFVKSGLFSGRNPSPEKLVSQLSRLSPDWGRSLERMLSADDEAVRRELAFLVDRRNRIAHGQNESVRMRKTLELCDMSLGIGDFFVHAIDPRT